MPGKPTAVTLFAATLAAAGAAQGQCEPVWSSLDGLRASWGFASHDEDGSGPRPPGLFVPDEIKTIARWDGWGASSVGDVPFDAVRVFLSVGDATPNLPAGLYVQGVVTMAGGEVSDHIARWNGEEWHEVGSLTAGHYILVGAMALFDEDGEGPLPPALFVGGRFQFAGGAEVAAIARWDGRRWSEVGGSLGHAGPTYPNINAMAVYDDGRGPALFVAGNFDSAGGKECWNIARWDGVEWEPVGPGLSSVVESMCVFDEDGPGPKRPALFVGGQFNTTKGGSIGELRRLARWDGAEWTRVGGWGATSTSTVMTMTVWDPDGAGPERESLYLGGFFETLPDGTPCNQIARWDGEQWHTVGAGVSAISGIGPEVISLAAFDEDGPGPNPGGLYVGGLFSHAGGVPAKNIARWGCPLPASPPCFADCDGSGDLTIFDFLCFQNLSAALDPAADCDGDTAHTFFDFLCYQNAFAAGCP